MTRTVPRTRYGDSPWIDAVPATKRPVFPRYRGVSTAPLVIVGGGLAGCMTAYACAAAGVKAVLVEAGHVGRGGSGRASGFFASEACASFRDLEARVGRKVARALFDASRRAPNELAATVKRLGIRARFDVRDAMRILPVGGSDKALRREAADRAAAGLDVSWLAPAHVAKRTNVPSGGGVRLRDWGAADPYGLLLGFVAAAVKRGAACFERSRVTRITFNRRQAIVALEGGTITTDKVIVCTGEPTDLFKPLRRHFRYDAQYVVMTEPLPAPVRAELGDRESLLCDTESPAHHLSWTKDCRAVFAGADQTRPPARQQDKTVIQRTGQLMYELSRLYPAISGAAPAYGWDVPLAHSVDDALYAGSHRNFPHHLFAFGTSHEPARAFLASRILARSVLGQPAKDDEHFGFARTL